MKTTFHKRRGPNPHANATRSPGGVGCPEVWNLHNGDLAIIGAGMTATVGGLPPTASCGPAQVIPTMETLPTFGGLVRLSKQPGDRNFETFGDGRDLEIHQVAVLGFNPRNGRSVQNDAQDRQPPGQVFLGYRRLRPATRQTNSRADLIPSRKVTGILHRV